MHIDTYCNEIFCDHGDRNTDYYASAGMFGFDVCNFWFFFNNATHVGNVVF